VLLNLLAAEHPKARIETVTDERVSGFSMFQDSSILVFRSDVFLRGDNSANWQILSDHLGLIKQADFDGEGLTVSSIMRNALDGVNTVRDIKCIMSEKGFTDDETDIVIKTLYQAGLIAILDDSNNVDLSYEDIVQRNSLSLLTAHPNKVIKSLSKYSCYIHDTLGIGLYLGYYLKLTGFININWGASNTTNQLGSSEYGDLYSKLLSAKAKSFNDFVRDSEGREVIVFGFDTQLDNLLKLNEESYSTGSFYLPILRIGQLLYCGPFIKPGISPCLKCISRKYEDNRGANMTILQFSKVLQGSIPAWHSVIANIVGQVFNTLTRPWGSPLSNNIFIHNVRDISSKHFRALKDPRCPVCGALSIYPETTSITSANKPCRNE